MYVEEYGYITIPMIALNAFILIALVCYAAMKSEYAANQDANK